jgi:hypothetical protein
LIEIIYKKNILFTTISKRIGKVLESCYIYLKTDFLTLTIEDKSILKNVLRMPI